MLVISNFNKYNGLTLFQPAYAPPGISGNTPVVTGAIALAISAAAMARNKEAVYGKALSA